MTSDERWRDYPAAPAPTDHVEPVPRRVRGELAGQFVLDTTAAVYVWEWSYYPRFYVPLADVDRSLLVDEEHVETSSRGTARCHGLRVGDTVRPGSVQVFGDDALPGLTGTARVEWSALDAWYEEDEQVFVHARNPYTRVDALRSSRQVRIELDGVVLAESSAPVLVFETGLPTRFYLDPLDVDRSHLVPSETVSACPYKGVTSHWWSVRIGDTTHEDLAWAYDYPTRQVLPIAGLIAFYDEKVDVVVDGVRRDRPSTHFV